MKKCEDELYQLQSKSRGEPDRLYQLRARKIFEVRIQRVVVWLYRGKYGQAMADLPKLVETISDSDLRNEAKRWLGFSFILLGDYQRAADELKLLLPRHIAPASHVRDSLITSRDLALAYAHLGMMAECRKSIENAHRYHKDMIETFRKGHDDLPRKSNHDSDLPADIKSTGDSLFQIEAIIDIVRGNYKSGLRNADKALNDMNRHLGSRHIKTLESAKLKAYLEAMNSKALDAEATCRTTLKLMRSELGDEHPQTLETLHVLVFVFRIQARLVESVSVGKEVCSAMQRALTEDHPQWLDARAELAANYRAVGDYALAARELTDVIRRSMKRYGPLNHRTLRYLSELAHVWLCGGYFTAAEKLALSVLRMQHYIYSVSNTTLQGEKKVVPLKPPSLSNTDTLQSSSPWVEPILSDIRDEYRILKAKDDSHDDTQLSEDTPLETLRYDEPKLLRVHPFLLHTLHIVARVVLQKPDPEVQLSEDILSIVLDWQNIALGPSHSYTLMVEFDLAVAKRDNEKLPAARKLFWHVYSERFGRLGKSHPDTLSAAREWMITNCAAIPQVPFENFSNLPSADVEPVREEKVIEADQMSETDLQNSRAIEDCSIEILVFQEARLGKRHPETLKTLLWIFIVQLDFQDKPPAESTGTVPGVLPSLPLRREQSLPASESQIEEPLQLPDDEEKEHTGILSKLLDRSGNTQPINSLHKKQETADMMNWKQGAETTVRELLARLRHESVRQQRYLEATNIEKMIALFYDEDGNHETAAEIRRYLADEARNFTTTTDYSKDAEDQACQYRSELEKEMIMNI